MLQRLLRLMAGGRPRSQAELAQALDVSDPLVAPMIEQLARQGYLKEVEQCTSGCEGCSLKAACGAASCGPAPGLRLWTLTEKGQAAAENR